MRSRTKRRYKNTSVCGAVTEFRTGQSAMIMHNSVLRVLLFLVYINVNIRKYMHCLTLLPLSPKLRSFNFASGTRGSGRISSTRRLHTQSLPGAEAHAGLCVKRPLLLSDLNRNFKMWTNVIKTHIPILIKISSTVF